MIQAPTPEQIAQDIVDFSEKCIGVRLTPHQKRTAMAFWSQIADEATSDWGDTPSAQADDYV